MKLRSILTSIAIVAALPISYAAIDYPLRGINTGCWNPRTFLKCTSEYEDLRRRLYTLADRNNDGRTDIAEIPDMCRRLGPEKYWDQKWHCANPSEEEMKRAIESYKQEGR